MTRQCDGIDVETVGHEAVVRLQPDGLDVRVPKAGSVIYLMNDDGRTIDSYRW